MNLPEQIKHILASRISNYVAETSDFGNIMISIDADSCIAFWDINFSSNMEAVMFQTLFLASIANHLHSLFGVGFSSTESKIIANIEDDSEIIIKPTTEVGESEILPFPGHYKGIVKITWKLDMPQDIGNGIRDNFKKLLNVITIESKKI